MLKYIGDLDLLVSKYGFEREPNGCYTKVSKTVLPNDEFGYGENIYDDITIMERDRVIEFNELYTYGENHDEEVSLEIQDLIKNGLVIKEGK